MICFFKRIVCDWDNTRGKFDISTLMFWPWMIHHPLVRPSGDCRSDTKRHKWCKKRVVHPHCTGVTAVKDGTVARDTNKPPPLPLALVFSLATRGGASPTHLKRQLPGFPHSSLPVLGGRQAPGIPPVRRLYVPAVKPQPAPQQNVLDRSGAGTLKRNIFIQRRERIAAERDLSFMRCGLGETSLGGHRGPEQHLSPGDLPFFFCLIPGSRQMTSRWL